MTSPVIGEKMVWARAEPWAHLQKRPGSWTHLVSTGLCGWCPGYHMRLNRSEAPAKRLSQSAERLKKVHWTPCTESVACWLFCWSLQWKENNGDICIVTRNEGPWHTGLGKHPAIGPAAHVEELQTGVHPPLPPPTGVYAPGFLNHGGAESSLALPMGPAFPISLLFAQRKEGTHIITDSRFLFRLDLLLTFF